MTQILFSFFSLLFLSAQIVCAQTVSIPPVGLEPSPLPTVDGENYGALEGTFSVTSQGSASYTIPLQSLPGVAGHQPKLSLSYDSTSRNGLIGIGWSLSGLSQITRCEATVYHDGTRDPVDFDELDRFCLDGQRLQVIAGGYGAANSEYRTENDTFSRVIAYGDTGAGPEWFRVWTKSGKIFDYGATEDATLQKAGTSHRLFWRVNQIADRAGNLILIEYETDQEQGENRISSLRYVTRDPGASAAAHIRFLYEDRTDEIVRYVGGTKFSLSKRLAQIEIADHEGALLTYRLQYELGPVTRVSRLQQVTLCNAEMECLLPTRFQWSNKDLSFGVNEPWWDSSRVWGAHGTRVSAVSLNDRHEEYVDFNRDGYLDRVWYPQTVTPHDYEGRLSIVYSDGTRFQNHQFLTPTPSNNDAYATVYSQNGAFEFFGDLNRDQVPDYLWSSLPNGRSGGGWFRALGAPDELQIVRDYALPDFASSNTESSSSILADVNGDGRDDYLWTKWAYDTVEVFLSRGSDFEPKQRWLVRGGGHDWVRSHHNANEYFVDMNGDGKVDRAWIPQDRQEMWVVLSNGTGFDSSQRWLAAADVPHGIVRSARGYGRFVDLNGDGLPDYVYTPEGREEVLVSLNTGTHLAPATEWLSPQDTFGHGTLGDRKALQYVDVTGDGLLDRIWYPAVNGSSRYLVAKSDGHRFRDTEVFALPPSPGPLRLLDVNGDGVPDQVSADAQVALARGANPDRLIAIVDGSEYSISIEYKPLSDSSVYRRADDAVYPIRDVIDSSYIVSATEMDSGLGAPGSQSTRREYFYEGLKEHLEGQGVCGFARMEERDLATGRVKETLFRQDFPLKGLPRQVTVRLADDRLVSRERFEYEVITLGANRYFTPKKRVVAESFERDGSLTQSETREWDYDHYGNILEEETTWDDGWREKIENRYEENESDWLLGQLTRQVVTKTDPLAVQESRTTEFVRHPTLGLVKGEITEPESQNLRMRRDYRIDSAGNIVQVFVSGSGISFRVKGRTFSPDGRYLTREQNELNHVVEYTADRFGNIASRTDVNGLVTRYRADGFGRPWMTYFPDGTVQRELILRAHGSSAPPTAPVEAAYYQRVDLSGRAPSIEYIDRRGRSLQREEVRGEGRIITTRERYDLRGRKVSKAAPAFGGTAAPTTQFMHDELDRVTRVTNPDGNFSEYHYQQRTVSITDAQGNRETRKNNSQGKTIEVTDALSSTTTYRYTPFGDLREITDPDGNTVRISYDERGNRIGLLDPNTGDRTYRYDTLGNLRYEQNGAGEERFFEYDFLNRLVERREPEGTTRWQYDTANGRGIGRIAGVFAPGSTETYGYDELSRLEQTTTRVGGEAFRSSREYNRDGLIGVLHYPGGWSVRHEYDPFGELRLLRDGATGDPLWVLERRNARRQILEEVAGNGVVTERRFDRDSAVLERLTVREPGYGAFVDYEYGWDELANLRTREEHVGGQLEQFSYDALHRLTESEIVGETPISTRYDRLGNITFRSDQGSYFYDSARPHAVTRIVDSQGGTRLYGYDSKGNRTSSPTSAVRYTSFQKPDQISGDRIVHLSYGPNRSLQRVREDSAAGIPLREKTFIGDGYERIDAGGQRIQRWYVFANKQRVAVRTQLDSAMPVLSYLHRDYLGSVISVTDEAGQEAESQHYTSWGESSDGFALTKTERGFGGHETLAVDGLIHMGGRVYDPALGRFLSADPFVQSPLNLQSLNRYSYALNNPLAFTDPSGYGWLSSFFRGLVGMLRNPHILAAGLVAGAAAGPWLAGYLTSLNSVLGTTVVNAFTHGFAFSATTTALQGGSVGDVLQSAVTGGFTAALAAGINDATLSSSWAKTATKKIGKNGGTLSLGARIRGQLGRMFAKSTVRGISTALRGGDMKRGFSFALMEESLQWGQSAFLESLDGIEPDQIEAGIGTLQRADGNATIKGPGDYFSLKDSLGRTANNIGLFRPSRNGVELPRGEWTLAEKLFAEGEHFSQLVNQIPGMNSFSMVHDAYAVSSGQAITSLFGDNGFSSFLQGVNNVITIPPMAAAHYSAMGYTDRLNRDRAYVGR